MSHPVWDGGSGAAGAACCHPEVSFNSAASILKDEDVLLIEHQRPWPACNMGCEGVIAEHGSSSGGSARCSSCGAATDEYSLFAIFDGHNGVAAARLAADAVLGVLEPKLPAGPPPPCEAPGFLPWREDVQLALVETLAELNRMFALKGILAGCTATLVLQVGWLLTVANLGDSRALLDTGVQSHLLTVDHRVATHKGERRRVEAMGNTIAPIDFSGSGPATRIDNGVGPLRIWPGGLCLSRAIGDFDVGDAVIPFPHVMQVMVPPSGGRLLVASDGVWDAYEKMNRIGSMLRTWSLDSSPQRLIQSIVRAYGGLRDDTTLVIADIVPPGRTFAECAAAAAQRAKAAAAAVHHGSGSGGGGGGCGCFGSAPAPAPPPAEPAVPAAPAPAAVAELEVLADVDVAAVMGLMPGATPIVPGWYDEYVGEQLFALAAEAMEAWQEAHERRTGRRPSTPPLESSVRAARAAREALGAGEAEPLVDAEGAAWALGSGSGMRRSASTFFAGAVAEGDEDYAHKFGHYKGFRPAETPSSGSPGSSMHSMQRGGAGQGDSTHGGRPEGSVRSGGYRYVDASVRAGSRFAGDASVRAGRYGATDASVRAGSRVLGDPSVRAGMAYYAGGSGGGGSSHGQPQGSSRGFRADPSIRAGAAFFRSPAASRDDGAAAAQRSTPGPAQQQPQPARASLEVPASLAAAQAAKQREEGEEGRQHGRRGGSAAGAALVAAAVGEGAGPAGAPKNGAAAPAGGSSSSSSRGASCALGSGSAPIPVPRSVAFGEVTVMGAAGAAGKGLAAGDSARELQLGKEASALDDSPVDHASMLRQTSSANNSSSMLGTIAEG